MKKKSKKENVKTVKKSRVNEIVIKKTVKKKSFKIRSTKISLPVVAGPDTLPLLDQNFTWESFEKFSKALIKCLYRDAEVHLFGVRGQKQHGIDLVAEDGDGNYFYVQNKKYKKYSLEQFRKAKKDLKLKPKKTILFLACEASADLRLEVLGDRSWEIWDVNDISDKVFLLDDKTRYNLIKKYFGVDWAKSFTDYNEFSSIVPPIDFFRNSFDSKKIFNHTIPFLGRDGEISHLKKFVKGPLEALILNAAGGVGKSRLLWEFSKECVGLGWSVLFIREGMVPLPEHFQAINSKKVVFIFDDAHRFNISPYLNFIYTLKIKIKIIFSTRPQGRQRLKLDLRKNNLESSEIQDYEISRFSVESAKGIVSKLLPQINPQHVWPLAQLLADSTLVGVLACNLVKRKSVVLSSLANEDDVKEKILISFTDELSGKIESKLSNEIIQKILNYISALAPIEYGDKKIGTAFVTATGENEIDVNECIADLVFAGVLVERGGRLRLSPDVLSDCLLERVCYLKNDKSSNFFETLFERVESTLRENLLKNISELDWRKKNSELTSSVLLENFWKNFNDTSIEGLEGLDSKLEIVKSISYFQPIESYEVVLRAVNLLSDVNESDRDYKFSSCLTSLVRICRDIVVAGYKVEELMMILWQFGKDDRRNLNSNTDHPVRQISDICSYERKLPIGLYERALNGLKEIIYTYDPQRDFHDPITILGGFLAKTAHSSYSEGNSIIFDPFHISYENTKLIRSEVFVVLKELALSNDLKSAYLSVNIMSEAMSPPRGSMGLRVGAEDAKVWSAEIRNSALQLMDIFKKRTLVF